MFKQNAIPTKEPLQLVIGKLVLGIQYSRTFFSFLYFYIKLMGLKNDVDPNMYLSIALMRPGLHYNSSALGGKM